MVVEPRSMARPKMRPCETGIDIDDPVAAAFRALVQRDRDRPFSLAQDRLQFDQRRGGDGDVTDAPLRSDRILDPLEIARGCMHVRLGHGDVVKFGRGVHDHDACRCGLANDLPVNLAFGRHVHHDIALHGGLTAQPAALLEAPDIVIALFDRVPVGQRTLAHCHAMLGETRRRTG